MSDELVTRIHNFVPYLIFIPLIILIACTSIIISYDSMSFRYIELILILVIFNIIFISLLLYGFYIYWGRITPKKYQIYSDRMVIEFISPKREYLQISKNEIVKIEASWDIAWFFSKRYHVAIIGKNEVQLLHDNPKIFLNLLQINWRVPIEKKGFSFKYVLFLNRIQRKYSNLKVIG